MELVESARQSRGTSARPNAKRGQVGAPRGDGGCSAPELPGKIVRGKGRGKARMACRRRKRSAKFATEETAMGTSAKGRGSANVL